MLIHLSPSAAIAIETKIYISDSCQPKAFDKISATATVSSIDSIVALIASRAACHRVIVGADVSAQKLPHNAPMEISTYGPKLGPNIEIKTVISGTALAAATVCGSAIFITF